VDTMKQMSIQLIVIMAIEEFYAMNALLKDRQNMKELVQTNDPNDLIHFQMPSE
jgi:hypothetical protein